MHFHVFVALAFLLVYRDWRAPAFGGLVAALHHLGFYVLERAGAGVRLLAERLQASDLTFATGGAAEDGVIGTLRHGISQRAGESGRGFAVVAEEVRKLAEESQQAAATIATIVGEIQAETRQAVAVVEDGARQTAESASTAEQTRTAFERIGEVVQEMSARSLDIALATQRIADGAQRMRAEMNSVATVAEQASSATENASAATEETSASTQQVAASADDLATTAEELQRLVGGFHLAS
jgi:methyl-accepting chemotaxis protein